MKDDLTVEKLKINERLQGVEKEVALLTQSINELKSAKNEVHVHLQTEMELIHKTLYGTGDEEKPGILILVDRLKIAQAQRSWQIGIVYTVVVGLAIGQVWHVFFK